jgi:hypothetical protein
MNDSNLVAAILGVFSFFFLIMLISVVIQRDNANEQLKEFKKEAISRGFADWKTDGELIKFIWKENPVAIEN